MDVSTSVGEESFVLFIVFLSSVEFVSNSDDEFVPRGLVRVESMDTTVVLSVIKPSMTLDDVSVDVFSSFRSFVCESLTCVLLVSVSLHLFLTSWTVAVGLTRELVDEEVGLRLISNLLVPDIFVLLSCLDVSLGTTVETVLIDFDAGGCEVLSISDLSSDCFFEESRERERERECVCMYVCVCSHRRHNVVLLNLQTAMHIDDIVQVNINK